MSPTKQSSSFDPDNEAVSVLEWWLSNRLPSEELGIRIADELRKAHALGVQEATRAALKVSAPRMRAAGAQVEHLTGLLDRAMDYGNHGPVCRHHAGDGKCDCGWNKLVTEVEAHVEA